MTTIKDPAALELYTLSPQQRRTWIAMLMGCPEWTQGTVRITGCLDYDALKEAIAQVVARHESLRTQYSRVPGVKTPVQAVATSSYSICVVDLSGLDGEAQALRVAEIAVEQRAAKFHMDHSVGLEAALLELGAREHLLLLAVPALSADASSLRSIARDLARFYAQAELSEEPVPYLQFAQWQNESLEADDEDSLSARATWRKRTIDLPKSPMLSMERPAGGEPLRFDSVSVALPKEVGAKLAAWCAAEAISPAPALAACWYRLFVIFGGCDETTVWYGVDGRKFDELAGSVGLFASHVPVHFRYTSDLPLRKIAQDLEGLLAESSTLAEYWPADNHVVEIERGDEPGFAFSYEALDADNGPFALESVRHYSEPFKLELRCVATAETIGLTLHYDSRRFCASDMAHVLGCYVELVTSALSAPDSSIGSLNILPGSAWRQIVTDWNDTSRSFACSPSVHSLFEGWVKRTPSAPALVFEDKSLTYGELNILANQLAHHLKKQGVGKDICVGLCVERSLEMIVGLLGIMKAGGAYVPLDPSLPVDRLSGMLADSGARLVVSHSSVCVDLSAPTILLDSPGLAQESVQNLPSEDLSGSLVYVIYTSGSTGKPKGVGIEHRNLFNYVLGIGERLGLEPGASYATVSTIGADLGNTSVFGALCWGGCLHVVSQDRSMDSASWAEYMNTHKVDCLKIVPSHLSALLSSSPSGASLLPKQVLVLGGEASRWDLVERIGELSASLRVFNHYGPTETTVGVLTYPVTAGSKEASGCSTVPLGRPLANSRVYVLNDQLSVCPVGVAGELYIGGAGVGRGYLGREDLTQERFISDPFVSGGRVYKTGDLCRWLSDGSIEFLGRRDDQVKVRGFRIELGEIESVLLSHSGVREAVVVVLGDDQVEKRLACYVVARDRSVDTSDLKSYLKGKLPEYMVPGFMGVLPRLPLTSNGKVDRRALPAPEELSEGVGNVGARTDVERVLVGIWSEVLRVDEVGVTCNFFDLGGHSLLATQVISRVREAFQVDVPLRALLEGPTIEKLARKVETATPQSDAPTLVPVSRNGALPLSFAQQRLWIMDQLQPGRTLFNVVIDLRVAGPIDLDALTRAFGALQMRHEVLRSVFVDSPSGPVQNPNDHMRVPISLVEAQDADNAQLERLIAEEATKPFDLAAGPIYRVLVIRLSPEEHTLVLTMHHMVSDMVSAEILFRDLGEYYRSQLTGEPAKLPNLPVQYADYAVWQRQCFEKGLLADQLDYWRNALQDAPAYLEVPIDNARPSSPTFARGVRSFTISSDIFGRVVKLCRQENATPFMFFAAAYMAVLGKLNHRNDILIGIDTLNRDRTEITNLIGFFVNQLVLRTDLTQCASFRDLLRAVRETALGAFANQELPFDKLVEDLRPARDPQRPPLYQVKLAYGTGGLASLDLEGCEVSRVPRVRDTAQLDITLFLNEHAGEVSGEWEYRAELYRPETIANMVSEYLAVINAALTGPDTPMRTRTSAEDLRQANRQKLLNGLSQ